MFESVTVIGAGRVGSAGSARLRERGIDVRTEGDLQLLCVPDSAIAVPIGVVGCAHMTMWTAIQQPALPQRHEIVRGQLVIRSDDPLPPRTAPTPGCCSGFCS